MRAPVFSAALSFTLLGLATVAVPAASLGGCDSPGGGLQSGDVTTYGADAGSGTTSQGDNLFGRLFGGASGDTEPACEGDACPPPPQPGPEPVCQTPLPPSLSVSTQCQTLCQKLVACTASTATAMGPCATECGQAMAAVAPEIISAAMGCYLAASCEDIQAAMDENGTSSTEPGSEPSDPMDMDAGATSSEDGASGAPAYPREDPMPQPGPSEETALQQCLDDAMQTIMEAPLAGADQSFCDAMATKEAACASADRPASEPRPGAGGADGAATDPGLEEGSWYCSLMAHLLNDTARDMVGACYALPCDQVRSCLDGLEPCLHLPMGSSSGGGAVSEGDTAEPTPAP